MKRHKWLAAVLAVTMLLGMMPAVVGAEAVVTQSEHEVEYPAAPAVAGLLLEAAGIDNRYGSGRDGGNYIRDVAKHMGPGTDFDGFAKEDEDAYWKAVALFLRSLGANVGEDLFEAELLSVVYGGTGCTFGSHAGDTLTLTFSSDIARDGEVRMYFKDATPYLPEVLPIRVVWTVDGNVLTLNVGEEFITPRPHTGDYVVKLQGIVDLIGNPAVVPAGGVLVEGPECEKVELQSVVYAGIGSTFGSHAGDTLTLTFSNDVYTSGTVNMYFKDEPSALPEVAVVTWTAVGNVLTLTANGTFITPRPEVGDFVIGLEGVVGACGCSVVVPDGGVEIEFVNYHWGTDFAGHMNYEATEDTYAVATISASGMEVWFYHTGWAMAAGWYKDTYSIDDNTLPHNGNPAGWAQPVRDLFAFHFPGETLVYYSRTAITVDDVPTPHPASQLLTK